MSIIAPQWFKDAVNDWPTAIWMPMPTKEGQNPSFVVSEDLVGFGASYADSAEVTSKFSPYDKFAFDGDQRRLLSTVLPANWLQRGAIIIAGHALRNANGPYDIEHRYVGQAGVSVFVADNISIYGEPGGYWTSLAQGRLGSGGQIDNEYISPTTHIVSPESNPASKTYQNYSRPQYRCAVLGISSAGDVVVGQGHPDYANERPYQEAYRSIGTMDASKFSFINRLAVARDWDYESGVPDRSLLTFLEVRLPDMAPIVFPPIVQPGAKTWWRDKGYCSEGDSAPVILDKRGFPIGAAPNIPQGQIPPDYPH